MQKKLIALAIAGLAAAPAFAQTHVTIYGIADVYGVSTDGDHLHKNGIDGGGLSGNRIGFRGTEELGSGLKAVFNYEFGTNIDSNSGLNGTRQAYAGLAGGFGTVVAGRLQTPGYYAASDMDVTGAAWYSPLTAQENAINSTIVAGSNARLNNAVAYMTPTMGGFSGTVAYAFGEQVAAYDTGVKRQGVLGLGAKYAVGGLDVRGVYHRIDNLNGARDADIQEYMLAAGYDFGAFRLLGSWQRQDVKHSKADTNIYQLGAGIKVGSAGEIVGIVSHSKIGHTEEAKSTGFGLGYNHNLSKRTTVYAGFGYLKNDDNVVKTTFDTPVTGTKINTVGLGIRHAF